MVTDGRMSGASGKTPAAIHMHPEAHMGGPLARVEDGDVIRVDPANGSVELLGVDLETRETAVMPQAKNLSTLGMNMFAPMRAQAGSAEEGASVLGSMA